MQYLLKNKLSILILSFITFTSLAQTVRSSKEFLTSNDEANSIMNATTVDENRKNLFEINYEPNSSVLSEKSKATLQSALEKLNAKDKNAELIVLSWSDKEYPSTNVKKLSKTERALADQRNKAIEKYLTTNNRIKIETYNMAEKPNLVEKWFNTTDNKLKNSLLAAGLPTTADSSYFSSKASSSILFIKVR